MIRKPKRKSKEKWTYAFSCKECDRIQEIHDDRKHRHGDYCTACLERADKGKPSPIHADEKDRTVRCDCFTPIPKKEDAK